MRDAGIRKSEICKQLGLSRTTVYRYIAGSVNGGCKNDEGKAVAVQYYP
ncbi:MAG: helix-turn-helix domain-containing protein [Oxalobacter sp.]|nr:helix-turn-helix domain-containing protein [Oxalobacter sp.]